MAKRPAQATTFVAQADRVKGQGQEESRSLDKGVTLTTFKASLEGVDQRLMTHLLPVQGYANLTDLSDVGVRRQKGSELCGHWRWHLVYRR